MTCGVHEEDLSALLDGELDALEERRVRSHIGVCPACRRAFAQFRALSGTLRASEAKPSPSAAFVRRVGLAAAALRDRRPARPALPPLPLAIPRPFAVAASLLMLLGLSLAALFFSAPRPVPVEPAPSAAALPPAGPEVKEALDRALGALSGWPVPAVAPGADLGGPLPEVPESSAPPAPSREDLLRALGLARLGDRYLSAEACARLRAHNEEEELLARAAERRLARTTTAAAPSGGNPVAVLFAALTPGEPRESGALGVVPIRDGDGDASLKVIGLPEAFKEGVLTITEERGTGRLAARNSDPARHVFLAAGEVLAGGHQDRLLTRPVLIPPRSQVALPVLCCEAGRSVGPDNVFRNSPGVAPPGVRSLLVATADQGAIWGRIGVELSRGEAGNATNALRFLFDAGVAHAEKCAKDFASVLADSKAVGFLVFSEGRFLGGEVFGSHEALKAFGPRVLSSYLLAPAAGDGAALGLDEAAAILAKVAAADYYQCPGSASGREYEFTVGDLCGLGLVPLAGSRPLHVSIFPKPATPPAAPPASPPSGDGSEPRTGAGATAPGQPGVDPHEDPAERRMRERRGEPVPRELKPPEPKPPERQPDPPGPGPRDPDLPRDLPVR